MRATIDLQIRDKEYFMFKQLKNWLRIRRILEIYQNIERHNWRKFNIPKEYYWKHLIFPKNITGSI
jgi:hypothetical protein